MIRIVAVGKLKDQDIRGLFDDYLKRTKRFVRVVVMELKSDDQISAQLEKGGFVVALDEMGGVMTSREFGNLIKDRSLAGDITFVLGGPDGLMDHVKERADMTLSLSKMTYTSQMARLILMEQIYRAMTLIKGVGYHR